MVFLIESVGTLFVAVIRMVASCGPPWLDYRASLAGLMSYRIREQAPGLDLGDRDQWQAHVGHFLEQAIQCGLVGYRTMDDGAAAPAGETQSVKPGGPSATERPSRRISYRPGLSHRSAACVTRRGAGRAAGSGGIWFLRREGAGAEVGGHVVTGAGARVEECGMAVAVDDQQPRRPAGGSSQLRP